MLLCGIETGNFSRKWRATRVSTVFLREHMIKTQNLCCATGYVLRVVDCKVDESESSTIATSRYVHR